jgi:hypothetical protein
VKGFTVQISAYSFVFFIVDVFMQFEIPFL